MKWYNHIVELLGSFLKVTFTFSLSDSALSYLSGRKRNSPQKFLYKNVQSIFIYNTPLPNLPPPCKMKPLTRPLMQEWIKNV